MEVSNGKKSTFSAISINRITAVRFREYSKTVSRSHSKTIDTMIDFFERSGIAPTDEVMIKSIKFQRYMMGRFDYIEEMIRTMEREQLIPIHDMLLRLFQGHVQIENKEPILIEKCPEKLTREEWHMEEGTVPFDEHYQVIQNRGNDQRKFRKILDKIRKVKPTFGKPYYMIEIDDAELQRLRHDLLGK